MVAGQGVEIGVNFFLENEAEIARVIAASGGKLGKDFSDKLSVEGKKAFDELVASADKAAKDVGARFSKTDLRFKNNLGQFLTQQELEKLSKTNQAFKDAVEGVNKFRSAVESAAKSTERNFNLIEAAVEGVAISLTSRLTDAVTVALGGVKGLIGGFLDLDGELRLAAAAAGETGAYEKLGAIVDKVGIEAAGTTKQVAELATSLVRAGFSVKEVETALPGVVRGAEATGTSFASFGDIVGNTLRGFQLDVEKTGHVVDVLVNTANSSNASIEGLGYTFEYTAPIAKALGISLEEVAAAAGLMANAGIQGSVAGTGLRTGLQKIQQAAGGASPEVMGLARGQERLTGVMRKLGAQVVDTNGKLLPLDKVFLSLKSGLEKLNQADQVQLANVLFGDEAGSKFLAILNQSDVAITKMFRDMGNSSGAADTARTAMSGMGLELQQLTGTLQSLGTQLGSVVAAGLRPFVGIANSAASIVSGLPGPVKTAAGALIALTAASTAATIAMMATNAVIKQIGFASLAAGASAAAKSIVSMGSGMIVILGIASATAILSGNFRETDRTTKQVLQTTIALGAGILVLRNMSIILSTLHAGWLAWNTAIRTSGALLAFVQALSGKGLATIAVAATAAAATYVTLGNMIKVNGEETEGLTTRASELKDEIKTVQDEIDKTKKLKLDTTEAQRKLDTLQSQLQQIETPLELKIDIQKVEQQIKGLETALGKLSQDAPQRGPIEAELSARRAFLDVLKAADEGAGADRVKEMSKASKEIVRDTTAFRNEIDRLTKQKIGLSSTDTEKRNTIDRRIAELQSNLSRRSEREQLEMINKELQRKLQLTKQEIIETEKASKVGSTGVTPFLGIVNPNADQPVVKSQEDYSDKIKSLKREEQLFTQKILDNQLQIEQSARSEERTARGMVVTAKEKLELAKSKLEIEQMAKGNIEKQASLESNRLRTIRDIADAYSGLASAQAALVQSGFDVQKSRNNRDISIAEQELQILKERNASIGEIAYKEQSIAQLKRDADDIDRQAMEAAIQSTQKRFEIEQKILELKQRAQALEQEGAIRAADQNVLQQRSKLLDLQSKLADPSILPDQKKAIQEQVKIQKDSIELSKQQVNAEKERAKQLGVIFKLERDSQAAKQQSEADQQRSAVLQQRSKYLEYLQGKAADPMTSPRDKTAIQQQIINELESAKEIEIDMGQRLMNLDKAAGVRYEKVKQLVGEIQIGNGPIEKIYVDTVKIVKATQDSTDAWKQVTKESSNIPKIVIDQTTKTKNATKAVGELAQAYKKAADNAAQVKPNDKLGLTESNSQRVIGKREALYAQTANLAAADARKNKENLSFAYSENGLIYSTPDPHKDQKRSWFDKEELNGIMKIEKATNMSADAFFVASEKATYLERSLAAVGRRATELEKAKWYEKALQAIHAGRSPDLISIDRTNSSNRPEVIKDQARTLAQKKSFHWSEPFAGSEGMIDRVAASLQDADARSKGLAGSIDNLTGSIYSARDAIGRPIDLENWNNYQEYLYGINGLYTSVIQKTDEFGRTIQERITDEDMSKVYKALYAITDQSGKATKSAQDLNAAYESLKQSQMTPETQPQDVGNVTKLTQDATENTQKLKEEWKGAAEQIEAAAKAAANVSTAASQAAGASMARWAGGGVEPGLSYQINELGQESWLDQLGRLRLLTAPAYARWTPPSRGMVLPASVTSELKRRGAFSQSSPAVASGAVSSGNGPRPDTSGLARVIGRLERGLANLEGAMRSWRPMDVTVHTPSSAGQIQAARGIIG